MDVTAGDLSTSGSEEVFPREESQSAKIYVILGRVKINFNLINVFFI